MPTPYGDDFSSIGELLVVDDDPDIRELLVEHLRSRGLRVATAADGRAAVSAIERSPGQFNLILTDLQLPGADGLAVLRAAKRVHPACNVVIITGYASLDSAIEAVRSGAYDYLTKPFSLGQLDVILTRIRDRQALEFENRQLARQVVDRDATSSSSTQSLPAKLDALESRLDRIERLLQDLTASRR